MSTCSTMSSIGIWLHDAREVELRDDVLGGLLHQHREHRRRLGPVAGLLASRDLVPAPQEVFERPQRPLHRRGTRHGARGGRGAGRDTYHHGTDSPLGDERETGHRAGDEIEGGGRGGKGSPLGRLHASAGPCPPPGAPGPARAEPDARTVAEQVARARRRGRHRLRHDGLPLRGHGGTVEARRVFAS